MDISTLFIALAVLLFAAVFFPDLFPRCACCRRLKPRLFFSVHRAVKLGLGYTVNRSVCRKCGKKYGIRSFKELEQLEEAKRKAQLELNR